MNEQTPVWHKLALLNLLKRKLHKCDLEINLLVHIDEAAKETGSKGLKTNDARYQRACHRRGVLKEIEADVQNILSLTDSEIDERLEEHNEKEGIA